MIHHSDDGRKSNVSVLKGNQMTLEDGHTWGADPRKVIQAVDTFFRCLILDAGMETKLSVNDTLNNTCSDAVSVKLKHK